MSTASVGPRGDRALAALLTVGGALGFVAAFVLIVEKLALLEDGDYTPSCSLNPVLNCGSIMKTEQASLLGFPNPLIGVAAFPVVVTIGVALLTGARLATWIWWGLQIGATAGAVLVGWLIFQSLYRIGALCPYCMLVWAVVLPIFWYVTLRNVRAGLFGARVAGSSAARVARDWHLVILTFVVLVVLALIIEQFWYYWRTLV